MSSVTSKPVTSKPVASKPVASEIVVTSKPAASEPITSKPVTGATTAVTKSQPSTDTVTPPKGYITRTLPPVKGLKAHRRTPATPDNLTTLIPLYPVRQLILFHLKAVAPVPLVQLNSVLHAELTPDIYRHVTLDKENVAGVFRGHMWYENDAPLRMIHVLGIEDERAAGRMVDQAMMRGLHPTDEQILFPGVKYLHLGAPLIHAFAALVSLDAHPKHPLVLFCCALRAHADPVRLCVDLRPPPHSAGKVGESQVEALQQCIAYIATQLSGEGKRLSALRVHLDPKEWDKELEYCTLTVPDLVLEWDVTQLADDEDDDEDEDEEDDEEDEDEDEDEEDEDDASDAGEWCPAAYEETLETFQVLWGLFKANRNSQGKAWFSIPPLGHLNDALSSFFDEEDDKEDDGAVERVARELAVSLPMALPPGYHVSETGTAADEQKSIGEGDGGDAASKEEEMEGDVKMEEEAQPQTEEVQMQEEDGDGWDMKIKRPTDENMQEEDDAPALDDSALEIREAEWMEFKRCLRVKTDGGCRCRKD